MRLGVALRKNILASKGKDGLFIMNTEHNSYNYQQVHRQRTKSKGGIIVALFLTALIVLAGLTATVVYLLLDSSGNLPGALRSENLFDIPGSAGATDLPSDAAEPEQDLNLNFDAVTDGVLTTETIYQMVAPQVVGIHVYLGQNIIGNGSGIIMSEEGYVITNEHVIEGATTVNVIMHNGDSHEAKIVGADPTTDLAVLQLINPPDELSAASFGDSNTLDIGEKVVAIGSPGGLAGSIAEGIISGPNSPKNQITGSELDSDTSLIQTTAAINPGNSGGALVNAQGQIIGVTSAKISGVDYEGIGFAIPISEAIPILEDLIKNGSVPGDARLGVTVVPVASLEMEIPGYDQEGGLMVMEIEQYSDLNNYGVLPQDIIISANGITLLNNEDLTGLIETKEIGDTLELVVWKMSTGKIMQFTAELKDSKALYTAVG